MGYNTQFRGKLSFTKGTTVAALSKLNRFLGEDCRDHPEWGAKHLTYIDLKLTSDFSGIEWDGSEKTYDLCEKINLVIDKMREEYPNFGLEGELLAQGEDFEDRWMLKIKNGKAIRVDVTIIGQKCECPSCGYQFIMEETT